MVQKAVRPYAFENRNYLVDLEGSGRKRTPPPTAQDAFRDGSALRVNHKSFYIEK